MAKSAERLKALVLRRQGESMKDIARILGVSKSAVSLWVRDVNLTKIQKEKLHAKQISAGHRGRLLGAEWNRNQKVLRIEQAVREAKNKLRTLSKRDLLILGLGLYWGEGSKASDGTVAIVNSDPFIILLMIRWFQECWGVSKDRLQPRVFISDTHKDREEVITKYWIKVLGIPRTQFRRMIFLDKGKKMHKATNILHSLSTKEHAHTKQSKRN
jgi:predicted transcriptional regulator